MEGRDRLIHVALCTDGVYPHAMGGMQRHSRLLAEHLAQVPDIRLTVLHPHRAGVFDPGLGIREVALPPMDPERLYLRELWRYSGRMADALHGLRPDAILAQGFSVWQGIEGFTSRLAVMPHGLEMHQGLTVRDRLIGAPFRWLLRRVARRAAVVVSLGGKLTPLLQGIVRGSGARVTVIPNAVHLPSEAPPYPAAQGAFNLLFVGRFAFNKGIDVLLDTARALEAEGDRRIRFILAGDGPERARMERDGLPGNVRLAGKVDDAELDRLYAECLALVLPTRFEGMPTVVLEAMARARPVIVSDVGAAAELLTAGNGLMVPPGYEPAFRSAVLRLANAPHDELERMGRKGRALAAQGFAWPVIAGRFAALARELAR